MLALLRVSMSGELCACSGGEWQ